MSLFRVFLALDIIFISVLVYFFLEGLPHLHSSSAGGLWLLFIGVPLGLTISAWQLKSRGWHKSANGVLGIVAIPPMLFVMFFGVIMISQPTWR